jgi:glycosyltransferase involved in cell wall biosynthesis
MAFQKNIRASAVRPLSRPASTRPRVVVFNNMITPYTNRLYNALAGTELDLTVLSCTAQEANRSWVETFEPAYAHEVLPGKALPVGPSRYAHLNRGIAATLGRLRPDVLVINGIYPSMLIAAWWSVCSGTPLALATDGWRHTMPRSPYHEVARPWVLRQCRSVIVCGRKGAAYMEEQGVAPHSIFVAPLIPAWEAPASVPPFEARPYDLLWVAHMNDEVKNATFFAEVAVALKQRLPSLRVRLVGHGPAEERVLARLRAAKIEFRHERSVDWRAMPAVYASAKALALPSLSDAWGLVCDEAMQSGVPCIVSPYVGAGDDAVLSGRNGFVRALDVTEWSARLEDIVTASSLWSRFSAAARADMKSRTLEASSAAFRAMVDHVLSPTPSVDHGVTPASLILERAE